MVVAGIRFWPGSIDGTISTCFPVYETGLAQPILRLPVGRLFAHVRDFRDEVLAYEVFSYLRDSEAIRPARPLIITRVDRGNTVYAVVAEFPNDLLTSIPLIVRMQTDGILTDSWGMVPEETRRKWEQRTALFIATYDLPLQDRLRDVPRTELMSALASYLRFRQENLFRAQRIPALRRMFTPDESHRFVADIVMVAEFYALPLDLFLTIRDLEQNPDVRIVWKRRTEPDELVLGRDRERTQVMAEPAASRQLTQEALRHANRLFQAEGRDYAALPSHLQPFKEEIAGESTVGIRPAVLTMYAGRLFRDLLDRSHGNINEALAIYNGGPEAPNRYEVGVRRVALYARKTFQNAAIVNGTSRLESRFGAQP